MSLAVGAPPSPAPATTPSNDPFTQGQREYWAFQKVTRPQAPAAKPYPVDSFVAAKLAEKGLEIAPRADKITLIRRASLDLIGLPPTPEEVAAFVNDDSPKAFETVIAAFAEHTDYEVGRLVDAIEAMGELDNTLFIYVFGDNGSSAEGRLTGSFNETIALNGVPESVVDQLQYLDEWGGPTSYPHFHAGWAVATKNSCRYSARTPGAAG